MLQVESEMEKKMSNKTVSKIMVAVLFAGVFAVTVGVRLSYSQGTKVSVNPPEVIIRMGKETTVNVMITNMGDPGIYSFEYKLYYDNTLLTAQSAQLPEDHLLKPSTPTNIFVVDPGTVNQDEGFVSFAVTLLGAETGKTGSGSIGTIVFKSTARGNATLELEDVVLVDPDATQIPATEYTVEDGLVTINGAAAGPDINADGNINIEDITLAALAFGTTPEHPRWDPAADVNKDGKVDIRDLVAIAIAWQQEATA